MLTISLCILIFNNIRPSVCSAVRIINKCRSLITTGGSQDPISVSIYLHEHDHSTAESTLAEIQAITVVNIKAVQDGLFHLEVNPTDLQRIANIDGVQAIEKIPEAGPLNDRIRAICGMNSIDSLLIPGKSTLTGEGQCVGVADSGVDSSHEAFKNPTTKIVKSWYVKGIQDDDRGHGTHVAATVLGSPFKGWQEQPVTGIAPSSTLSVQGGIFRGAHWIASTLFEQAYNTDNTMCRIQNNSWGVVMREPYVQAPYTTADAEMVDQWALAHPDFLIVYAAGNDGLKSTPTGAQVGSWCVAKNVLTVGATFSDRPFKDDFAVDYSGATTQRAPGHVTGFSSRGPVLKTQRTKPDIVAPGAGILSARATHPDAVQSQYGWPYLYGSPPGGFKDGDRTIFCSGTSMAAPAVSGCSALLREALVKWHNVVPSAPLMKALLINGTDDLKQDKTLQGYGQINMQKVLRPVKSSIADIEAGKTGSGHAQQSSPKGATGTTLFKATISNSSTPEKRSSLQITLVYHDFQGDIIQNRMNLLIGYKGTTTDTTLTHQLENVHRVLLNDLSAGDTVSIGVSLGFLNNETPWAVVWNEFEI